jgi:glycogen operon protein
MILMGDEVGRSQQGNNNTYCQDNELNWLDWNLMQTNADLLQFVQHMIAFRHAHPVLRNAYHLSNQDYVGSGYADISWHGTQAWHADWGGNSRVLAWLLCGKHARGGTVRDDYVYVACNMYWDALPFELPGLPDGLTWHLFANTGAAEGPASYAPGSEPALADQQTFLLGGRSMLILVGR